MKLATKRRRKGQTKGRSPLASAPPRQQTAADPTKASASVPAQASDKGDDGESSRGVAFYGTVFGGVAVLLAIIAIVVPHLDYLHPPKPDTTEVMAANPSNSTPASGEKFAMRVVCAWKSAVTARADAMTCMLPPANFVLDPCFTPGPTGVDPAEVLCPNPQQVKAGTAQQRMRVIGVRLFVDGPPFPAKALDDVMANDLPWAIHVADSGEWCVLTHWMDAKDLGVNVGSRSYVCATDSLMTFMNGADAFFSNQSRLALKVTTDYNKLRVVSELTHDGSLWTAQLFEPSSSSTRPVRMSTIVY